MGFTAPVQRPINLNQGGKNAPWDDDRTGALVVPGQYSVTVSKRVRGEETVLAGSVAFNAKPLGLNTTANKEYDGVTAFRQESGELYRAVQGATRTYRDADERLKHIRKAIKETPTLDTAMLDEVDALTTRLADLGLKLNGDRTVSRRSEPTTPSISRRASWVFLRGAEQHFRTDPDHAGQLGPDRPAFRSGAGRADDAGHRGHKGIGGQTRGGGCSVHSGPDPGLERQLGPE